ncbi:MAG: hypothetical protein F2667_11460 [Actinobacteria bacterium]|uniref:Unannotated protein n=1 Tax=freshwater metagenome TaxID=449393 RepID=A0A6J6RNV0_9ZZZZ|nr:hypothetical protein [Actinomycetota bacterium]
MTTTDPTDPPAPPAAHARFRSGLLLALVVVIIACLVSLTYLFFTRTSGDQSFGERITSTVSGDEDLQPQRDEVMSVARQFMLRLNTYGPDLLDDDGTMPEYRTSVGEVITPKFEASFEQNVGTAEQIVAQSKLERSAEIFATGVASMDPDSASVLVAGSFTNSYEDPDSGEQVDGEPAPFRVAVQVVLIDGTWLVDDFAPVTGETQTGETEQ